jgi:hypothetical protein
MILVDMSMISISTWQSGTYGSAAASPGLFRSMIISRLLSYQRKFSKDYGQLVICCDSSNNWRKDIFEHYKCRRKLDKEGSSFDWNGLFQELNSLTEELDAYFKYPVVKVDRAEGDDVIATICKEHGRFGIRTSKMERLLIISSDKDFKQLHKYCNVEQWHPSHKKHITIQNPERYLREMILRGDGGDDVPNFLSDDRSFVDGIRQKSLMEKKVEVWQAQEPEEYCDEEMLKKWNRNNMMVNLDMIPSDIMQNILCTLTSQRDKIIDENQPEKYFIDNGLKQLKLSIEEFKW